MISPGINPTKSRFKKLLNINKKKILTDLDLFSIFYPYNELFMITGTNGKSTTCKMLQHILNLNKKKVFLGGNIGKPILDINPEKKSKIIIEASSFQLAYSKMIKPKHAILLNISNDHLDWHENLKNYRNAKFKIFSKQKESDFAYLSKNKLINHFKTKRFKSKLIKIDEKYINNISYKNLNYLPILKNFSFVYYILKKLKMRDEIIKKGIKTFKGLEHRYEIFLKKKNNIFINDSKATSFDSTKHALAANKNIYWIVGGIKKKNDKINISKLKKNINEAFIIGKDTDYFKKVLKGKVKYSLSYNLKKAIKDIFFKLDDKKENIILFSPACASFDQFKNFEKRGRVFKKYVKIYAKKYL